MIKDILFNAAVEIAHNEFWLADSPDVIQKAKDKINDRPHMKHDVAHYVAVICKIATQADIDEDINYTQKDLQMCHLDDDMIMRCGSCKTEMDVCGFGDCNGWECPKCGRKHFDIASFKMANE